MRRFAYVLPMLFYAMSAHADQAPDSVPKHIFLPLESTYNDPTGKVRPAMHTSAAPTFIPVINKSGKFFSLPRSARNNIPMEDSPMNNANINATPASADGMSPQQAQQILSIFEPAH